MTPEEFVAAACPKINDLGWAFYFAPATMERGKELGLDGFRFYFLGRGGVLGDTKAAVVVSAFGYFNPSLIELMWNSGCEITSPTKAAAVFWDAAAEYGRATLSDVDGLDVFCEAAGKVFAAADPTGLALFAGAATQPFADDLPARAMQLLSALREFRGSAHLVAVRAAGLDAKTAHFIRRPNDVEMFGWSKDDPLVVTEQDRAKLAHADEITDQLVLPAFSAIDEASRQAVVEVLGSLEPVLRAAR